MCINVPNCDYIWQCDISEEQLSNCHPENHFISRDRSESHYRRSVHYSGVDDACSAKWWLGWSFILECYMIGWQTRAREAKRPAHQLPAEQLSQEQRHLFTRPYCSRPEREQINNHDSTGRRIYTETLPGFQRRDQIRGKSYWLNILQTLFRFAAVCALLWPTHFQQSSVLHT